MTKIKLRQIIVFCTFFCTVVTFAQVGIGLENPTTDLDVKGDVRMRQLANPISYNRTILANEEGDLAFFDQGEDTYSVKDVLYKLLNNNVTTQRTFATNINPSSSFPLIELGMDLTVEIKPFTTTAVAMEYNVPVTSVLFSNAAKVPSYMGITMVRKENGLLDELEEGSRKFTLFNVPVNYQSRRYISMPVSGKATDIVVNNTRQTRYITYSAKGYIENGSGDMYFGNPLSDFNYYGSGVFIIQVYEKKM